MSTWKGIVGKGFKPQAFATYASSLTFATWRPQFIVLHNTAVPTFAEWHTVPGEQRMKNLERFYRDTQHWSAGPHLFVADDLARTSQCQAAADVVHHPGNFVERIGLQRLNVGFHQTGQRQIALR